MSRPALVWKNETRDNLEYFVAYLGGLRFGTVGRRYDGSIWWDATDACSMRWTAKSHGETKSIAYGRKCVERAWCAWADRAGL